jgi:hypothetical protein
MNGTPTANVGGWEPAAGLPGPGESAFRSRFLGLAKVPDRVLLTPVGFLMQRLAGSRTAPGSFWPLGAADGVPVIHGPQGRPIVDCVFAMPPGSEIVFVGLAGGLRPPASVGTWVQVDRAWAGGAWHQSTLAPAPCLPSVRAATVGSLTESWLQTESLREIADAVDLETGHVLEVAAARGVLAASLLLVSDAPPAQPFWETDLATLTPAADTLLGILRPWLRGEEGKDADAQRALPRKCRTI